MVELGRVLLGKGWAEQDRKGQDQVRLYRARRDKTGQGRAGQSWGKSRARAREGLGQGLFF